MAEPHSIPWEQQALHIAIDTLEQVLPQKPKDCLLYTSGVRAGDARDILGGAASD